MDFFPSTPAPPSPSDPHLIPASSLDLSLLCTPRRSGAKALQIEAPAGSRRGIFFLRGPFSIPSPGCCVLGARIGRLSSLILEKISENPKGGLFFDIWCSSFRLRSVCSIWLIVFGLVSWSDSWWTAVGFLVSRSNCSDFMLWEAGFRDKPLRWLFLMDRSGDFGR